MTTTSMTTDGSALSLRRDLFLRAVADRAVQWYDADGHWIAETCRAESRECLWIGFALYPNGQGRLADAVIRQARVPEYHGIHYNIFDSNIATLLLLMHRQQMADDVAIRLEKLVRDSFEFKPGNRQPDYQFHGHNDNMPAKATMGLVLGGEMLGEPEAIEYGLWNLRQLAAMLRRRGVNSEFNSPTYTPLTLHAIAAIVEYAQHDEARSLALKIEERLWLDVAARFHPEMGVVAGPYSRAYTVDVIAHASLMSMLLWLVLGKANPDPMAMFESDTELVLHHLQDLPFNCANMAWLAAGHYHLPPRALDLMAAKRYPYRAVASTEQGDTSPYAPARPARIETVHHPDYSLGTCDVYAFDGTQCESYFVTYKQRDPVRSFRDVGTIHSKIVINDENPGQDVYATSPSDEGGRTWANHGEPDLLHRWASTFAMQHDGAALVLTQPSLRLAGEHPLDGLQQAGKPVSLQRLSELVIFSAHFGGADQVMVGDERRNTWAGSVPRGQWICCRRGHLYVGIRPMVFGRDLQQVPITLERVNKYEIIRGTFHDGPQRTFTVSELLCMFGGFVAEHASVDAFASLEDFAAFTAESRFTDYFWNTRRVRYRRMALRPMEMEASISPGAATVRYATINGRPIDAPIAQYDGVDTHELPILNEPFTPVPAFFPWETFDIEWCPMIWAIGDRETDQPMEHA